jgi:hypothetical protein
VLAVEPLLAQRIFKPKVVSHPSPRPHTTYLAPSLSGAIFLVLAGFDPQEPWALSSVLLTMLVRNAIAG